MTRVLKKLLRLLSPSPPIAGVEVSDFYVRFFYARNDKQSGLEVRLTPGVVKDGKVVNKEKFLDALAKLKQKLGKDIKKVSHVIVTTHSSSVFLQMFNLPYLPPDKIKEAAKLNLQMISPLPVGEAYYDWDMIGEDKRGGQLVFLGAFAERSNVDAIIDACHLVGFIVVAVEPSIIALHRSTAQVLPGRVPEDFYLMLHVSNEGMDFAGVYGNKVRFDYFVSWLSMYEGATEISQQVFEDTIARYTQQVLNFALTHGGVSPKEMVLVASEFLNEIRSIIEKNFSIKVTTLSAFGGGKLETVWGVVYGAYLRGLVPRSEDNLISLTSISTEEEFRQSRTVLFVELWRNITAAFSVSLLLIFAVALFFLQGILDNSEATPIQKLSESDRKELEELRSAAREFNSSLVIVSTSREERFSVYPYFSAVENALSPAINLTRISFQSPTSPILLNGTGSNNDAIKQFRQALEKSPLFSGTELPLNSIVPAGGGRLSFSIKLMIAAKDETHR